MPTGKRLTEEQRREICEARMLGESRKDIAEAYGIKEDTVTKIVWQLREQLEKEEDMAHRECIVAGDKKNGRLVSTSSPHRFEGTCIIDGKAKSKTFTADNATAATEMWRSWCSWLSHSRSVPTAKPAEPVAAKAPAPNPVEPVAPKAPAPAPEKHDEVKPTNDTVYVIWARGDTPRLFGAYRSMESALKVLDDLNDVAAFLISDRVFEVEEVALNA